MSLVIQVTKHDTCYKIVTYITVTQSCNIENVIKNSSII